MASIGKNPMQLGVCPQHDLVWESLTGPEHLRFYGRVKGLSRTTLTNAVDTILHDVGLGDKDTRRKAVSKYSGGMKRRLSVACALIGAPQAIILDEPTTGLDPESKQKVWDVIKAYRQHAAVLLTSHSMQEAEALSDVVGILVDGQLRAVGSSADLKDRFSSGYKLSITVIDESRSNEADDFVHHVGGANTTRLLNRVAYVANYEIDRSMFLPQIYAEMHDGATAAGILHWELTHCSLEEVFLRVVRDGAVTTPSDTHTGSTSSTSALTSSSSSSSLSSSSLSSSMTGSSALASLSAPSS